MNKLILILLLFGLLPGCALFSVGADAPQVRLVQTSEPYQVHVRPIGPARVSEDGFEARFDFHVFSPFDLQRNALVQELRQTMTLTHADGKVETRRLSLVEAFKLQLLAVDDNGMRHYALLPGQRDRHAAAGLKGLPASVERIEIRREVFAYVANVAGADFSPAGFAHLPTSEDGAVKSSVGRDFNQRYQQAHQTRGRVVQSATAWGMTYRMSYLLRRGGPGLPQFIVDHGRGVGAVQAPVVRYAASR